MRVELALATYIVLLWSTIAGCALSAHSSDDSELDKLIGAPGQCEATTLSWLSEHHRNSPTTNRLLRTVTPPVVAAVTQSSRTHCPPAPDSLSAQDRETAVRLVAHLEAWASYGEAHSNGEVNQLLRLVDRYANQRISQKSFLLAVTATIGYEEPIGIELPEDDACYVQYLMRDPNLLSYNYATVFDFAEQATYRGFHKYVRDIDEANRLSAADSEFYRDGASFWRFLTRQTESPKGMILKFLVTWLEGYCSSYTKKKWQPIRSSVSKEVAKRQWTIRSNAPGFRSAASP